MFTYTKLNTEFDYIYFAKLQERVAANIKKILLAETRHLP